MGGLDVFPLSSMLGTEQMCSETHLFRQEWWYMFTVPGVLLADQRPRSVNLSKNIGRECGSMHRLQVPSPALDI